MNQLDIPFNLSLLELNVKKLEGLRPIRSLDRMDGATDNFHPDGLFSTVIFGKSGDPRRNKLFSYINIKLPVMHPVIFADLVSLKQLYQGILSGKEYAVFDEVQKDFVRASALKGETGYAFFLKHWEKLEIEEGDSAGRQDKVKLVKTKGVSSMVSQIIVSPAGIRDIEVSNGRIKEDEVNGIYRKLLSIANTISVEALRHNPALFNKARYSLQLTFNTLFDYYKAMIDGKDKLILGKWASRKIFNGTRNVISSMETTVHELAAPGNIGFKNTQIGIYQSMKSVLPMTINMLRDGYIRRSFLDQRIPVKLVDPKTLKAKDVTVPSQVFAEWTTFAGLERLINSFRNKSIRHKPVMVEGCYLGLIRRYPDKTFEYLQDIGDAPQDEVRPITMAELLYLSVYQEINKFPLLVTRYPVAGVGSIYPSKTYLKTTVRAEALRERLPNVDPRDWPVAFQFPINGEDFIETLSPHPARLAGLVAD